MFDFPEAEVWSKRLRSEVDAEDALIALVDRVDLIDLGIPVSLKLPHSITEERGGDPAEHFQNRRRAECYARVRLSCRKSQSLVGIQ